MRRKKKSQRGRPVEKPLAEPIDDAPENVARASFISRPKASGEWEDLKESPPPKLLQQQVETR